MKRLQADNLTVEIHDTRLEMGQAAAQQVAHCIEEIRKEKEDVTMLFAAAPSQNEVLACLKQSDIDWSHVIAFHMDEYIGLPEGAPQKFAHFLEQAIWNDLPFQAVYPIDSSADPAMECKRYEALLKEHPLDLILCGIGENCHLAFNDPWVADFCDPQLVKIVSLDLACRQQQVNDGCFAELSQVPMQAITLTLPVFVNAKRIVTVVPSATKADAVYHTIHETIAEKYPSTLLRRHPKATLYVDAAGAQRLNNQ